MEPDLVVGVFLFGFAVGKFVETCTIKDRILRECGGQFEQENSNSERPRSAVS
jgi:hypothetical protein